MKYDHETEVRVAAIADTVYQNYGRYVKLLKDNYRIRDVDLRDDIIHDALLRVCKGPPKEDIKCLTNWFYGVIVRTMAQRGRSGSYNSASRHNEAMLNVAEDLVGKPLGVSDEYEDLMRKLVQEHAVKPHIQAMLYDRYVSDFSITELCAEHGITRFQYRRIAKRFEEYLRRRNEEEQIISRGSGG